MSEQSRTGVSALNRSGSNQENSPITDNKRPYRLAHQLLNISEINFESNILIGFTQLTVWPLIADLRCVHLNCRQCRVHRILLEPLADDQFNSVDPDQTSKLSHVVNLPTPIDLPTIYNDPDIELSKRDQQSRSLDSFQRSHLKLAESTSSVDRSAGEITIRLPPSYWTYLAHKRPLLITLEFSLSRPQTGFYFPRPTTASSSTTTISANTSLAVTSNQPGNDQTSLVGSQHAFTSSYPSSASSSRLWFPCIDSCEPCCWTIEVTCPEDMVAIAPGELIDAPVYTSDLSQRTYRYYLAQPVGAHAIGLAVGFFQTLPDASMGDRVTHFCPNRDLLPQLKHSVAPVAPILDYYQTLLASQYPFATLKTVFVDNLTTDCQAYASMLILSIDLLYSPNIIDQAFETRKVLAAAIAQQFFGLFLASQSWHAAWLPLGISGYLAGLYQKHVFGNNEYRYFISHEMQQVTAYEHNRCGIILDPSKTCKHATHFSLDYPELISPAYLAVYAKKAHLVVRILELRFGQPLLMQVLNKLLVLGRLASESMIDATSPVALSDEHQASLGLTTSSFRRIVGLVTGQDAASFFDQWIYRFGHARLLVKYYFNRKRNVVELDVKQDLQSRGSLNYTGPLAVMLQEVDGPFMHSFIMEEGRTSGDLPCHSKSRKNRRKKIPLSNGDEIDLDLGRFDSDSPLLWLRVDPDLAVIRTICIDQPDFMWHFMLAHDRDCLGQLEAACALKDFASAETRHALASVITNERLFYRLRMQACFTLCHAVNEMGALVAGGGGSGAAVSSKSGAAANAATSCLIPYFWQLFSSPAGCGLVRQNNFTNLQHYFIARAIIGSLATLRVHQVCPKEVVDFFADLLHHNDNSANLYSDCYYRADLIKAMRDTLTPAIIAGRVASSLPPDVKLVVDEVLHQLNLESVQQPMSYKGTVTVACLSALRRLQRLGFLPAQPDLFQYYARTNLYVDVRRAGLEALCDFIRAERDQKTLDWVLDRLTDNSLPRRLVLDGVQMLTSRYAPFQRVESNRRLDTPSLVDRLWKWILSCRDARLRCCLADLYFALYGPGKPGAMPHPAVNNDDDDDPNTRPRRSGMRFEQATPVAPPSLPRVKSAELLGGGGGTLKRHLSLTNASELEEVAKRRPERLSDDEDD